MCPHSQCFTWSGRGADASIQTCIWECVHTHDCQTATYFDDEKICTLFAESHTVGEVQSSGSVTANVIAYPKNRGELYVLVKKQTNFACVDPIRACPSTVAPNKQETTDLKDTTSIETSTYIKIRSLA